jgi:hypothetical protein
LGHRVDRDGSGDWVFCGGFEGEGGRGSLRLMILVFILQLRSLFKFNERSYGVCKVMWI